MRVYAARVLTTNEPDLYPVGAYLYWRGETAKLVTTSVEEALGQDAAAVGQFVDDAGAGGVVTCELVALDLTEVAP